MRKLRLPGVLSVALLAVVPFANPAAPPGGEMCGQVMSATGEMETSIQACMGEVLDEQLKMLDGLEEVEEEMRLLNLTLLDARGTSELQRSVLLNFMQSNQGGGENMQMMREQIQRAMLENVAVEDADYEDAFERADQEKGKNCKFSDTPFFESLGGEYPPGLKPFSGSTFDAKFGDGKCNVFKARVDSPGEADDNQVVQVNERKDNMCERVCADREGNSDGFGFNAGPPKRKDERKNRMVSSLTDNLAAARRANENMQTASARLTSLRYELSGEIFRAPVVPRAMSTIQRFDGEADPADDCEPRDVARGLVEAAEVVGLVKNGVAIVTASLELAKETARPPTKQDAAGFNASSAETPFSVATGISKIVEQSFGFIESGLKVSALIADHIQENAQAKCLQQVQTGVADLKEIGNETNEAIEALDAKVNELDARLQEVILLLNTPAGRRPGFPSAP